MAESDPFAALEKADDPFAKGASRYPIDPGLTAEAIADMSELTDISKLVPDAPFMDRLKQSALNAITPDPMEIADILVTQFPEDVDVRLSPDGIPIARNKKTGYQTAINKPGFSGMDVYQTIGMIGAYSPAGRFAAAPTQAVKTGLTGEARRTAVKAATRAAAARGAAGAGVTEAALQQMQEESGGRFDYGDIAIAGVSGAVPDLIAGPFANTMLKGKEMVTQWGQTFPGKIQDALKFANDRGLKIATSDALAETLSPARKIFIKAAERIPLVGLGKMRLRQQAQHADVLEEMAERFGVDPTTNYGGMIVNAFANRKAQLIKETNELRQAAFKELAGKGNVDLKSVRNAIMEEMEKAGGLEPDQARRLTSYLENFAENLDNKTTFSFKDADNFLSSLYADEGLGTKFPGIVGDMKGRLGDALYKDMSAYAKKHGDKAFNQWDLSRKGYLKDVKKLQDETLKKAISQGNIDESVIDAALLGGDRKSMRALYNRLTENGKEVARKRVLAHALSKAGATSNDIAAADPMKFVKALDDENLKKALKEFWPEEDQAIIRGAREYLRLTGQAAKTGEGVGMTAAMAAGTGMMMGVLDALVGASAVVAGAARAHESDAVRNLLLNLHHAKGNPELTQSILAQTRPLIMSLSRQYLDEDRDPFAPSIEPDIVERMVKGSGRMGKQLYGAISGFRLPGVSPQEGVDRAADAASRRLLEMRQQMQQPPPE